MTDTTRSTGDPLVSLVGVTKAYGDVTAVDDIDLTIRQGEFFSLVGPSGCGKTTTLRLISGFEQPSSGSVRIAGESMADVPPEDRDTNLVFQQLALFPHMTVTENVSYGLQQSGIDQASIDDCVEEYLSLVDLEGFGDRQPSALSGGQQQRVALARALVNEPSVLLLDEPLSSLDRKLRQQMQVELRSLHEQTAGGFFYVTHDQSVAMTLSDRIAVMNDGRIEQVGTPEAIYREPANAFVADFVGDTNLLSGTAETFDDGAVVTLDGGGSVSIPVDSDVTGPVTVSIRPEALSIVDDGQFTGTVTERYFQGDRTTLTVVPDGVATDPISVVVHGRQGQFDRGVSVELSVSSAAPVVFQE